MKTLLASLLLVGCAASTEPATDDSALTSSADGIAGTAEWRRLVTGTPTYGHDATEPFLALSLKVTDGAVREAHPGFDGLERPFVLVPHADGTHARLDLRFTGTSQEGYISLHPVDHYELGSTKLTAADLAAVVAEGVTIELETNVGTLTATVPVTEHRY